ncbi:hypothetical protein [Clostridium oryzae]|uniref:Uncharacterized protein n=1 Tax=Clostridium oryzae TaxID=1450648 RepID=A0A1V4IVL0_9CLOT|nr:hypothetical protein [Clostridium oryzae]OPJ63825.1 hypothetical protein CLORY_10090 [Clostridium oryzae]
MYFKSEMSSNYGMSSKDILDFIEAFEYTEIGEKLYEVYLLSYMQR